jgi:predicted dehydrogenase
METVNLGIIGLGYMGKIHLRNCLKLKTAKLLAVSDVSRKSREYAQHLGVKYVYDDYRELLNNPEINAVIVSLPTHLHAECCEVSAEAGKSIFLEKPLARNPEEGEKILEVCRKHDVKLMVGYHFRYSPEFLQLKTSLREGLLGEAQVAHATMVGPGPFFHRAEGYAPRPVPSWWFDKELTGGGALTDLGCHMFNLVRWYFGEVRNVKCYVGHRFNMDFEDYAICLCRMKSGTEAVVTTGWFSREASAKVEIFGTSKIMTAERRASNKVITFMQMLFGLPTKFNLPYLWELQHFIDCLREDKSPSTSGEDAVKDLKVISLAYRNAVSLDDFSRDS